MVVASHGGVIVQSMLRFLAVDLATTGQKGLVQPRERLDHRVALGSNPYSYASLEWELVRFNHDAHLAGRPALVGH